MAEGCKLAGALGFHQLGLLVILNVETGTSRGIFLQVRPLSQSGRVSQPGGVSNPNTKVLRGTQKVLLLERILEPQHHKGDQIFIY